MANYLFDGSQSLSIPNFDPAADAVFFNELNAADIASVAQTNSSVVVTLTNGNSVTLGGVVFASLTATSLQAGVDSNLDFAIGTAGDEPLAGNVVIGQAGVDTITVPAGDDGEGAIVFGNQGDDVIVANGAENVRIYGGQDNDTISGVGTGSLVVGGLGEDEITIVATAEADNFVVYGGNGVADAADGGDTIGVTLVTDSSATIYGNGGDDTITVSGDGSATIYGGAGIDTITVEAHDGLVVGGLGADIIEVTASSADATFDIYGGNGTSDPTDGGDTITVDLLVDSTANVYGNGGDDDVSVISTAGGTFNIFGGAGNDDVYGATPADAAALGDGSVVYGGLGEDTINVSVVGAEGSISVYGGNGQSDAADGDDVITVDLDTDQTASIYGNAGDDALTVTGAGSANVFGGAGDDTITVGAGGGVHALAGGIGSDTFDFSGAATTAGDAISQITDFNFGEDHLVLAGTDVASVATVNAASVASFAELQDLASDTPDQATVITIAGGDFAGSYAAFGDQIVEITGYTGTINADAFNPVPTV